MGTIGATLALGLAALSSRAKTLPPDDPLCGPLKAFVASVKAGDTRTLTFETSWFAGSTTAGAGPVAFEKTCAHNGYAPARPACEALVKYGSIEFAGSNAMRAVQCLSPRTRFAPAMQLSQLSVDFSYGSDDRGENVSIELSAVGETGRKLMKIDVDGY
jgi:hypothetical protein